MVIADIIGNLANGLFVVGSGFKKIIWLRISIIIASSLEIWYFILISPTDLWTSILWDGILILTNIVMISIFLYERGMLSFSHDEAKLYFSSFSMIDKSLFKKLLKAGNWMTIESGSAVVKEDEPTEYLLNIFSGHLAVTVSDKIVANLKGGNFVGEMSFLSGGNATATVTAKENSRFYAWDKQNLIKLLKSNSELDHALKKVFSSDLISKLLTQNKQ